MKGYQKIEETLVFSLKDKTKDKNCISVNRNGSVGHSFYHNYEALFGNDTRKLKSKYENEYNVPYTRTGTESIGSEIEYDISSLNLDNLFKSLKNLINSKMMKKDNFEERMILNLEDDNYSTEEAHNEISEIIKGDRKVEFNHLLKNKFSKSRIVTLFLCILDMFKNGEIDIIVEEKNFFIKSIK